MKPGDFPLRSLQSRAATRSLIAARKATQGEGLFVRVRLVGLNPPPGWKCTCPIPPGGEVTVCRCFCPPRMTIAEAENRVAADCVPNCVPRNALL